MKVRGQGTIVALEKPERTCRKWQLRVSVGYDWGSKQYKTKTRRVSGTKTEAKAELRNFIAELEGTSVLDANTVTLGSYAEDWLESRKSQPQPPRAGTMRNNSVAVRTIQKGLGSERLIDLDFQHRRGLLSPPDGRRVLPQRETHIRHDCEEGLRSAPSDSQEGGPAGPHPVEPVRPA